MKRAIAQTTRTCSKVALVFWSFQRSEPTSRRFKAFSDILFSARSRTIGSSLVFVTGTLVRTILLRLQVVNNCSSFQIQFSISHFHPQGLSSLCCNFWLLVGLGWTCQICSQSTFPFHSVEDNEFVMSYNSNLSVNILEDLPVLHTISNIGNIPHLSNSDPESNTPSKVNVNYFDIHKFHCWPEIKSCSNKAFSLLSCIIRSIPANFDNLVYSSLMTWIILSTL